MAYLDLAEVPALLSQCKLFSSNRWGPVSFREEDHLMTSASQLDHEVREWFFAMTGEKQSGPIRLLTLLRCWGYYFSPLNLYYLFRPDGNNIAAIVAEVSNTPWREKHRYLLLPAKVTPATQLRYSHSKQFHVSPFMDMDTSYHWHCTIPHETLEVTIRSEQAQNHFFSANLSLKRRPFTDRELALAICRNPWSTVSIVASIYWQALKLWWKKCPCFPHPNKHTKNDAPASQG